MKTLKMAALAIAVCVSSIAFADEGSCATELCLSSKKDADQTPMCKDPVETFFKIKKKRHGVYDAQRTLQARRDYIYSCESGNTREKEFILATYGMILK